MFCKKCGTQLDPKDNICPKCGYCIGEKKNTKKSKKVIIATFILLCICLNIFGIVIYHSVYPKETINMVLNSAFYDVDNLDFIVNSEEQSEAVANEIKEQLGLEEGDSFVINKTVTYGSSTYYKLKHYYENIPVWGQSMTMEVTETGKINVITSNCTSIPAVNLESDLEAEALQTEIAEKLYNGYDIINNGKTIYYDNENKPILAYDFTILINNIIYKEALVNAYNGEVIKEIDMIDSVQTKVTLLGWENAYEVLVERNNGKYYLKTGNIVSYTANVTNQKKYNALWDLSESPLALKIEAYSIDEFDTNSVDAYGNTIDAINYFQQFCPEIVSGTCNIITGFQYLLGKDKTLNNYQNNAFHSKTDDGYVLAFGYDENDHTSLAQEFDVVAHELGHELFSQSMLDKEYEMIGGNEYEFQALNEAFSDIFAICAENECKGGDDWVVGEKVSRNLANPTGNSLTNYNYFINEENNHHENSTIISHVAYLIWKNSDDLNDYNLLMELWYRALQYLQPNATMADCENAVYESAKVMIAENKIASKNREIIENAFNEVGIIADLDRTILVYLDNKTEDKLNNDNLSESLLTEEGYYGFEEENEENLQDLEITSGGMSIVEDYKGIAHLTLDLRSDDGIVYEEFVWNEERGVYEQLNLDNRPICNLSVSREGDKFYIGLNYEGEKEGWRFEFKKYQYLNGTNVTIAVKNYFESSKTDLQYAFQTNDFDKLFNEMYLVPVYEVGENSINQVYTVLVTSQEFEEPGVAKVYLLEDVEAVMNGEKTFREVESLEEFNVYSYFNNR